MPTGLRPTDCRSRSRLGRASGRGLCSSVLTSILYLSVVDLRRQYLGADLEQIGTARQQRFLIHPQQMSAELVGDLWPGVAPATRKSPRPMSISSASVSVTASPAVALSRSPSKVTMRSTWLTLPRSRHHDLVADCDAAGGQCAGKAAKIQVGAVHPLHREAQR